MFEVKPAQIDIQIYGRGEMIYIDLGMQPVNKLVLSCPRTVDRMIGFEGVTA